jgi:hypothetical protein
VKIQGSLKMLLAAGSWPWERHDPVVGWPLHFAGQCVIALSVGG